MKYRRWYPTATTLSDGRVLVVAGQRYGGYEGHPAADQADIPETFTPNGTGGSWLTLPTSAQRGLPWYPWMFQLPDGRVFNAGPNYTTGFFNATANTWTNGPAPLLGTNNAPPTTDYGTSFREYGTAVMYQPGKIMVLGGADKQGVVTRETELIDFTATGTPAWRAGAPMNYARYHVNATLLPDGSVLVTGGTAQHVTNEGPAVLPCELWTPDASAAGGSWRVVAALDAPRLYHSTAVLLPDATVLTAGGGQGGGFADHPNYQVFTPPYLCQPDGNRPSISYAPPAVAYGQSFKVQTPDASHIRRATWVRLSSVTHSFNMNQRFLELAFTYPAGTSLGAAPDELLVTAPGSAAECPPGHYMLFLLNDQSVAVPSVARIMQVGASNCASSLGLTVTPTYTDACNGTVRFAVSSSANCQADYVWQVNGASPAGSNGQSYIDCPVAASSANHTLTVQVTASRAATCTGPPVSAGNSYTMYFRGCSSGQPCAECRPAAPAR